MRHLLLLASLAVIAAGCGGSSEPREATAPTGPGSEITGESLDGEHVSLADFRGKRVLLNVWSSW